MGDFEKQMARMRNIGEINRASANPDSPVRLRLTPGGLRRTRSGRIGLVVYGLGFFLALAGLVKAAVEFLQALTAR